jgi:YVTN family beta-propeller protein
MTEFPSGVVTFLFTDIEGSTRLVKTLRDRYADVLADHQRLLRDAFARHGGREIDTQGDSFFVAFSSGRDAVMAAVDGQLALATHKWPDGAEVKVRMGIHTGRAIATDGRYTGLAVHRAARIGAAGHGGQVLVSQATQTLLEDEEEELEIALRDLGEQRLKDLDRPVRLYQIAAPGLPTEFPPPRSEAELAAAAEAAVSAPAPFYSRPFVLGAVAVALAAIVVAGLLIARSGGGGLSAVKPNHVGIIDPSANEIVGEVPVGVRPGPIAATPAVLWVGNLDDRTLTRVDTRQRTAVATLPLGGATPTGIAVGANAVWVAHGFLGQLSRVEPEFNEVGEPIAVAGRTTYGSVAIGEGSVWAVYGDSVLARIDPATGRVAGSALAGSAPADLVFADGDLWVVNSGDATVDRFNPSTFDEGPLRSISVGARPTAIAFGEGALWVANTGDDRVTRIDPDSGATDTIRVGDGPTDVAVGAGAVWVANLNGRTVSRIDPATDEVVATIELGNAPAGVTVAGDVVWVTVQAP